MLIVIYFLLYSNENMFFTLAVKLNIFAELICNTTLGKICSR